MTKPTGIFRKALGLGRYDTAPSEAGIEKPYPEQLHKMMNDPNTVKHVDMMNNQVITGTQGTYRMDDSVKTAPTQPKEPNFPLQGQGKAFITEMARNAPESMIVEVLIDMASSDSGQDRVYAAAHHLTPISTVVTMLGDKDRTVRYVAEKRLAADAHDRHESSQKEQEQP